MGKPFLMLGAVLLAAFPAETSAQELVRPPQLVGEIATPSDAFEVVMMGRYALVPNYAAGLIVIEVTDPQKPAIVGSYDTPGLAVQCALAGDLAFVADHADGGLQVLDVADPRSPSFVGSYASGGAVVMAAWHDGIVLVGNILGGVDIVDVSDPTAPAWLSSFATRGSPRHAVFDGDLAYLADYEFGVLVMDIANPSEPEQVGSLAMIRPLGIDRDGDTLYVACAEGLRTVDVSAPDAPVALDVVELPGPGIKVVRAGEHALVAAHVAGGLQIIDVADPSDLAVATSFVTGRYTHGVAVRDDHAFLADAASFKVFRIFEAAVRAEPLSLGRLKARF